MALSRPRVLFEYCLFLVLGYSLSAVFGLSCLFYLAARFIKNPFEQFWTVKTRELPPPCLADPSLGTHAYIQLKNVKLHYVEAGDRSRPLMLFLHGFPELWYSWRHQLKEFSSDYWVVAVDMRGYGESEKPIGRKYYKMQLLVDDVKNLVTALGKERCTLVAHDWGGLVAWYVVLTAPQMIDSYILMNTIHPQTFYRHIKKNISQLMKSWYIFFFQLPWLPELRLRVCDMQALVEAYRTESIKSPKSITDEDIEAYKFYFGKPGAFTAPINYYRANFMHSMRTLRGRGQSPDTPPGLILFGDRDIYVNKEIQEETIGLEANSTLVYVKDATHFVQQDDPVAVNSEMRYFLNKLQTQRES